MKCWSLIAIFLLSCSCGSQPEKAASPPTGAVEAKQEAHVVIDEAAQRRAGIRVIELRSRPIAEVITANGQLVVNEDETWQVGALTDGRVDEVLVKVGDSVRSGDVLARMHSHEVHEARAAYREAVVELERARSGEAYSRRIRDRVARLLALKSAAQQEVETAEADLRKARAAVEAAQAEVQKERVHLTEFLGIAAEDPGHGESGVHRHDEDDIPIRAPASGLILHRKATVGTVFTAGGEMFTITNPSSLWMIAAVNEADLGRVRPGQAVRILVRAYPGEPVIGRILKLGEELDAETRALQVRILVPNDRGRLKPQMYATAEIEQARAREIMMVPASSIQELAGQKVVFVRNAPDRFVPRSVQIGRTMHGEVEVTDGLKAGDSIAIEGVFQLKSQLLRGSLERE